MEPRGFFCQRLDSSVNGQDALRVKIQIPTPAFYVDPSSSLQCTNCFSGSLAVEQVFCPSHKAHQTARKDLQPCSPWGEAKWWPSHPYSDYFNKPTSHPFLWICPHLNHLHRTHQAHSSGGALSHHAVPGSCHPKCTVSRPRATFDCLWWTSHVFSGNESLLWQKIQNKGNKIA